MSSSKTRKPTPEAAELTSQVKKGSHSPELRAVAVNTRPRPAPASLWKLMRVIGARIDHACATLDKSRRVDETNLWRKLFWDCSILRFYPLAYYLTAVGVSA